MLGTASKGKHNQQETGCIEGAGILRDYTLEFINVKYTIRLQEKKMTKMTAEISKYSSMT
jgi:hypothetical protein